MFPFRDHNPSRHTPYVTILLIAMNIGVFLVQSTYASDPWLLARFYEGLALRPADFTAGKGQLALVTYAFLHEGYLHLAGNMLFLWVFGDNLEDQLGHIRYAAFYLASAVGAVLVHVMSDPSSDIQVLGASGAVAGVMGGYFLLFPKARIDVFFFFIIFFRIIPIPAWIVLGVWFGAQIANGVMSLPGGPGIAYWAHVGGFVIGLLLILPMWLRRGGRDYWRRIEGHPPHPETKYKYSQSRIPMVRRRR